MKVSLFFILASDLLVSCVRPSIYKSERLGSAVQKHRIVAVLPASVRMKMNPGKAKKMTLERLEELSESSGYDVQNKMFSWLIKRSEKRDYSVAIQDIGQTNRMLEQAGIAYSDIDITDASKIANILGVDALLRTTIVTNRPMSTGAALALIALDDDYWGVTTHSVESSIRVEDGSLAKVLWRYDYTTNGSVGTSTKKLVNRLMKNASRKFPYRIK